MTKEIADAFGLEPDLLEGIADDEHPDRPGHCESCDAWAKKYAELETVLSVRDDCNRNATHALWESQDFCV